MTDDDDLDHDLGAAADTSAAHAVSPQRPAQAAIPAAAQRGHDMARDIARPRRRDGSCRAPDNTVDPAGLLGFLTQRDTQRRHRRRTFAVGTATAVLAGAAMFWIGVEPLGPPTAPSRPPVAAPIETWSDRAQVTLVSISYQLDQIDQTTQVWNTQIADQYQGMPTPAPVAAMLARKVLLEQQRAILTSELATAHELDQARTELATLDQQIATLSAALASSTPSNTAAGQADAGAGLRAARTLAEQMRATKQAEVDRLTAGMRSAEQTPMPDRIEQTTPVTQAVLSLDTRRHPDPSHPGIPGQTPPGVAPGGLDGRRAAQQLTTGQPVPPRSEPLPIDPSTRGPDGNTSTGIGRAVTTAAAGAVHTVDTPAQKILTPGGGHRDNGSTTGDHRGKPTENTPGGAVSGATHTVIGAVGAVGDTAGQLIAPSGNPHSNDNHRGENRSGGTTRAGNGGRDKTGGSLGSTATRTVTGAVDNVGATAQNVLGGSSGSGTATGRHRATTSATPTGATASGGAASRSSGGQSDSASSRAAQLQYAAQIVKSAPGGTWASGAIAMAQQVSSDTGSDGTGSSDSATPRSGGGSGSARTSTQASTTGSGSTWGSSWSAHPTTSAASSTNSRATEDSSSSSERTSSSSSTSTGSATGSGGAGGSSSSPASSDGGASPW
jgi:hypothetical protein